MSWADQLAANQTAAGAEQDGAESRFGADTGHDPHTARNHSSPSGPTTSLENNAFALRKRLQIAQALAEQRPADPAAERALASAASERQDYWMDTCREVSHMHLTSKEILDMYQKYGCRFCEPSRNEVQDILSALDAVLSFWDRDHPELFYQTLELNFPELIRHG